MGSQLHSLFGGYYSVTSVCQVTLFIWKMTREKKKHRYPIRLKTLTMVSVLAVIISAVAISYYAIMVSKLNKETFKNVANDIAGSTAQVIRVEDVKTLKNKVKPIVDASETKPKAEESSKEELKAYLAQFDSLKEDEEFNTAFNSTKNFLNAFADTNSEFVDCLYIQYVDASLNAVVYLCDTDESETNCAPGQLDPIHEENKDILKNPLNGFKPVVIRTARYGWLIIAGAPIKDGDDVVAYAMVDIDMKLVHQRQVKSIVRLTAYLVVTLLLIGALEIAWVRLWMIRPLKKLTRIANEYDSDRPEENHEKFQALQINTRDEIEDLADSMKIMENDVYERFNELLATNKELKSSREETKKMQVLANQDGLTGVKNKISYNAEVELINNLIDSNIKVEFAVVMVDLNYLKDVNDSFGHDTGDVALIKLAKFICETFKFSPVYRIGGDEFVAICRGKDYQDIDKLVDELKAKIAKTNKPGHILDGENISAAVGFSKYDSKVDKNVDDVFKRADQEMYLNKRALKRKIKD